MLLKCDCIIGSIVNGIREPFLYSFTLSSAQGHKIFKETKIKHFNRINKSVLFHITVSLIDDDYKAVNFNGETVSYRFTR